MCAGGAECGVIRSSGRKETGGESVVGVTGEGVRGVLVKKLDSKNFGLFRI